MALFIAEHEHPADRCPAANPEMAGFLLDLVSNESAQKKGITIRGDAVANGAHHLYLIVEAPSASAVREYFQAFAQAGSLEITPASHCEEVVQRGAC
ncbi:MAG: DUF3303 family protein [Thermoplasmata archaeon]